MAGSSSRRSRPKAEIEPIHVSELLGGAGMRGFLSILNPAVQAAHWEEFSAGAGKPELLNWFSERAVALLRGVESQEAGLHTIAETVSRIHRGVMSLQHQSERVWRSRAGRLGPHERRTNQ